MTARKLTDSEKETILHLYRTTGETSSTLAVKYGVSTSTISRILKSNLPADEYEALIQQKRALRTAEPTEVHESTDYSSETPVPTKEEVPVAAETLELPVTAPVEDQPSEVAKPSGREKPVLRSRKRSSTQDAEQERDVQQLEVPLAQAQSPHSDESEFRQTTTIAAEVFQEVSSEKLITEEDLSELDDELDDDLDEDDEDDEDFGDDLSSRKPLLAQTQLRDGVAIQILPLAEAPIPRTCYLVVDRAAELIAPPLQEFGDLGQIPAAEVQAKTLPIFDNHRVAKRYSNPRTQRVIKLPDGRVLSKASSHLQAKGITRLLIDGRVYSLN